MEMDSFGSALPKTKSVTPEVSLELICSIYLPMAQKVFQAFVNTCSYVLKSFDISFDIVLSGNYRGLWQRLCYFHFVT